jgi:hypothetical protein
MPEDTIERVANDDYVVTCDGLPAFGFNISRPHLHRLIRQGRFPKPFKITANRNGWLASCLRKHRAERIATRDLPRDTSQQSAAGRASVAARRAMRKE